MVQALTSTVVVAVAPTEESSLLATALLDACDIGMHPIRCVFGHDTTAVREGLVMAVVSWEGSIRSEVRIAVGMRVHGAAQWQTRSLFFSPMDPDVERWRTAGFAIATMVGEVVAHEQSDTKKELVLPLRGGSPARDVAGSSSRSAARHSWIDAEFAATIDPRRVSLSAGGELRFSSRLDDRWFLSGGLRGTLQPVGTDGISIFRPGASAGCGAIVVRLPERMEIAIRAQLVVQLIHAAGTDPSTGTSASGERWLAGAEEGLDVSWMWSSTIGVVAGVGATQTIGSTDITAHGRVVAEVPGVYVDAVAGLRIALP